MYKSRWDEIYDEDKKEYILNENEEFLRWFYNETQLGYRPFIKINELQKMIDIIANWFNTKYPDRDLSGTTRLDERFDNIKPLCKSMTFEQLRYRLPNKALYLLDGVYTAHCYGNIQTEIGSDKKVWVPVISVSLNNNNYDKNEMMSCDNMEKEYIMATFNEGIVSKFDVRKLGIDTEEEIIIDDLLDILNETNRTDLDYSELNRIVFDHESNFKLTKKIIEYATLKVLYNEDTRLDYGYERATRMIGEFNKHIDGLELETTKIDEIMGNNNTLVKKKK